jgi:hypothetical protein
VFLFKRRLSVFLVFLLTLSLPDIAYPEMLPDTPQAGSGPLSGCREPFLTNWFVILLLSAPL